MYSDREITRPESLDQTDQQAAEHRPRQRADAAQHRRRERLHAGEKADEKVDHAVIERHHHAGDRGERRADDEGQRDRAVDIDPDERRHGHVLLAGALRAAERRGRDQDRKAGHQRHGQQHDDDLEVAQLHAKPPLSNTRNAALDDRRQRS